MRRLILSAAIALPFVLVVAAQGCGPKEKFEDFCAFLGDQDNCFAEFGADVGAQCGSTDPVAVQGGFSDRKQLAECFLYQGGKIVFDPPLDVTAFPPALVGFKINDAMGNECGAGSFDAAGVFETNASGTIRSSRTFSISINTTIDADAGTDAAVDPDAGPADTDGIEGGTFSATKPADREVLETSCPSGEAHKFNLLQLNRCVDDTVSVNYAGVAPRATLEASAGGIEVPGYVRLSIFYPPYDVPQEGAQSSPVYYFDCAIPGAPPLCLNGVKDGVETDVDCGGTVGNVMVPECARCEEGQLCVQTSDCGAGLVCGVDKGLKKCLLDESAGGAGGTGGAGGAGGGGGGGAGGA